LHNPQYIFSSKLLIGIFTTVFNFERFGDLLLIKEPVLATNLNNEGDSILSKGGSLTFENFVPFKSAKLNLNISVETFSSYVFWL